MLPRLYDITLRRNYGAKSPNTFRFGRVTHVDIPINKEGLYLRLEGDTNRTVYERANLFQSKGAGLCLLGSGGD